MRGRFPERPFDDDELATCLAVLEALHDLAPDDPIYLQVERAVAHLGKSAKKKRRLARKRDSRRRDRVLLESAERVVMHRSGHLGSGASELAAGHLPAPGPDEASESPGASDSPRTLHRRRRCYVCKARYRQVHGFYHSLCPPCAARNYRARTDRVDLRGRRALITGGRIKIGFELALKLLRDGARVVVTTRFPRDAARRYAACEDFARWRDRLAIQRIDLRFLPAVMAWIDGLVEDSEPFDIVINNAAQTVWRPPAYYASVRAGEREVVLDDAAAGLIAGPVGEGPALSPGREALPPDALALLARGGGFSGQLGGALDSLARAYQGDAAMFPAGVRDEEDRPVDLRPENSWVLGLDRVEPIEVVEVMVVNVIVPFLLASRLVPSLMRSRFEDRYVVNVSAMEGKFDYGNKTPRHPHTNMAKAALNMMTRTAAEEYAGRGIYMNSVDTGWITQENPQPIKQRMAEEHSFCPPLDVVDGAARVYAPIVRGVRGDRVHGFFFKDYQPTSW